MCPICFAASTSTASGDNFSYLSIALAVAVTAATPIDDLLGATAEFQDIHPIANAVHDDDVAAVRDFNVVGHVGAIGSGRNIETHLHGSLWIADVPRSEE